MFTKNILSRRYVISISTGHVLPYFPYVSDLGVIAPEASLFTLLMCTGGCVTLVFSLIRFDLNLSYINCSRFVVAQQEEGRQGEDCREKDENRNEESGQAEKRCNRLKWLARASFSSSSIVWLGFVFIGSFRNNEMLPVQIVHNCSAAITFSVAVFDVLVEMLIARRLGHQRLALYRLVLLVFLSIFGSIHAISGCISFLLYKQAFIDHQARLFWRRGEPAFELHVVSTTTEWVFIYLIAVYFLTFHQMFTGAKYINNKGNINKSSNVSNPPKGIASKEMKTTLPPSNIQLSNGHGQAIEAKAQS